MDNMKHRRLQEMDRSDFGVVDGEPDIRGWDVRISSGEKIGEVEDLIVDAQERKVRYMIVDMDDSDLDLDDRKVLVPIGLAQLDDDDDDVMIHGVSIEQLKALPAYDADRLNEDEERKISSILGREHGSTTATTGQQHTGTYTPDKDSDFYRHEHFDDNNLYKNRTREERMAPVNNNRENRQDRQDAEHREGLRIWHLRGDDSTTSGEANRQHDNDRDMDDQRRMDMVRNRRQAYEDRRGTHNSDRDFNQSDDSRNDNRDPLL